MRRARRSSTGRAAATTPAKTAAKRVRRVVFAEEPEDVRVFDKRDPVGEDFHAVFAEKSAGSSPSEESSNSSNSDKSVMQPLTTASDVQTTPQKFSLHEFVLSYLLMLWFAFMIEGGCRLAGREEVTMDTETMTRSELQSALVLHGLDSRGTKAQLKVWQTSFHHPHSQFSPFLWCCRHGWSSTLCSRVKRRGNTYNLKQLCLEKERRRNRKRPRRQHQNGWNGDGGES